MKLNFFSNKQERRRWYIGCTLLIVLMCNVQYKKTPYILTVQIHTSFKNRWSVWPRLVIHIFILLRYIFSHIYAICFHLIRWSDPVIFLEKYFGFSIALNFYLLLLFNVNFQITSRNISNIILIYVRVCHLIITLTTSYK